MITEHDLQEAIAECQGIRRPNADTCIKLASFYTIMDHMYSAPTYSFSAPPTSGTDQRYRIDIHGESEFMQLIEGMYLDDVVAVIDELMDTLKVMNPRLYSGVMKKMAGI